MHNEPPFRKTGGFCTSRYVYVNRTLEIYHTPPSHSLYMSTIKQGDNEKSDKRFHENLKL